MFDEPEPPLSRNVAELSTFLDSDRSIADTLTRVARLAVDSVPPAVFAGITMMVDDRVSTQAFTDPTCPEIDQVQYESGRGPCLESFRRGAVVVVASLAGDDRWPEFGEAALAHGVRSTLSLPMRSGDSSVGALNLYGGVDAAFGDAEAQTGSSFAAHAGVVLVNAQAYWGARLRSEHLQLALEGREPIEMATGFIMNARGCDGDEALDILVRQSRQQHRMVRDVAAEIIDRSQRRRP